jgi:hypothetical protein
MVGQRNNFSARTEQLIGARFRLGAKISDVNGVAYPLFRGVRRRNGLLQFSEVNLRLCRSYSRSLTYAAVMGHVE